MLRSFGRDDVVYVEVTGFVRRLFCRDDFADEGGSVGGVAEIFKVSRSMASGSCEEGGVFGEEGGEGLTVFELVAQFGVHLDAGVGADGVAGFGAACSETLDGPAYLLAVHAGRGSRLVGRGDGAGGGGFVECGGVFEDGWCLRLGLR